MSGKMKSERRPRRHSIIAGTAGALFAAVVLLVVQYCIAGAQENTSGDSTYVPVTAFDPSRDAGNDVREAVREAARTGRFVLIDVGGNWCSWCRKLDDFFEKNPDVDSLLHTNFVLVKVNFSEENRNESFLSHYPKVAGYPHFFVLDGRGTLLHSQNTGKLESGDHHDRGLVTAFLKKWAPQSVKD